MKQAKRINVLKKVKLFDGKTREGLGDITNIGKVADACVVKREKQWWMFFGGLDIHANVVHLCSATLPEGSPLGSSNWTITTSPDDPTQALPLVPAPKPSAWDRTGFHCPSYARGWNPALHGGKGGWQERIYYASSRIWNLEGPYAIGCPDWNGQEWVRNAEPVFQGVEPWEHHNVAEQNVIYYDGAWRMWYCAAQSNRHSIGYAQSQDGISGWEKRSLFFPQGAFDAAIVQVNDHYEMIAARSPDFYTITASSGLWWSYADQPSENPKEWSEPVQLLKADDGTLWHRNGIWKPTFHYDEQAPDRRYVFFNGLYQDADAPFDVSIGRLECSVSFEE